MSPSPAKRPSSGPWVPSRWSPSASAIAERAGPSVTLAFIVAGVGCAFAGLCYAEFASMIPIAGSAYTYSYATMGEFVNRVLSYLGLEVPYQWRHSPLEMADGVHGIMNIPAVVILALLSALLI